MLQATKLAKQEPNRYEVGSNKWVTARFTAGAPMPKKLWEKWLDESYALSLATDTGRKPAGKSTSKKKITKKPVSRKKASKKTKVTKGGT